MNLDTAYTSLALMLNGLIDRGFDLDFPEAKEIALSGDFLAQLEHRFPFPEIDLGLHTSDTTVVHTVNEHMASCASTGDLNHYGGLVGKKGLCALVAWSIQGAQQMMTRGFDPGS